MDALQNFPDFDTKLQTEKGMAVCQKQDIFKGLMWFAYVDNYANWHVLKIDQVREIVAENKLKNKVSSLEDYAVEVVVTEEKDFNNAMGQESLTRFDQPKKKKRPNKNRKQGAEREAGSNIIRPAGSDQGATKPAIQQQKSENRGPRLENKGPRPENKGPRPERSNDRKPNPNNQKPAADSNAPRPASNKIIPNKKDGPKE